LRMRPDKAVEKYQFISNNDESLKRIAFDLVGIDGLTIDGNDTKLLFTGFISAFNLENCRDITIENLSIDYTRTFHSEGTISNVFDGGFDIRFPDDYRVDLHNGLVRFRDSEGTVYPYGSMLEFDVEKREPAYYAHDIWIWGGMPAEKNDDGSFRFYGKDKVGTVGNTMVFGALSRYNPAFTLADCSGVTIKDVDLYHCCGMGVIAQRSRDIELNRLNVLPAEGRMISITADATHFVNCAGYLRMIDFTFKNQKDDATNIHGLYMAVDSVLAPDRMMVRWHNSGQYGVDFIRPGMTLELVDNDNMTTYARRTVKDVNRLNKIYTEVSFTEPLPEGVKKRHVVAADDEYPDVLIKGCHFSRNRARGLLLGSRGPIVIEDNYFHIPGAAILFEGDGNFWWEQSGVRDVTIRNNVFDNGNYGCSSWGDACIAVGSGIPDKANSRYHKNIRVENNTFRVFDPRIVSLYCVDGFEFTPDNRIEMTDDYTYAREETRNFVATDCDNIQFPQ
ncbi:MAG: right-handed parallel beta-helix repeat-containing protein, partial [Muribaculaceae bacterium]|nr:right-handed parallel beta-helix repeat-containing protein [Muribaculaceae bacterium]